MPPTFASYFDFRPVFVTVSIAIAGLLPNLSVNETKHSISIKSGECSIYSTVCSRHFSVLF